MAKEAQATEEKTEEKQDQQDSAQQAPGASGGDSKKQAQAVEFSEVEQTGSADAGTSIDVLLDMSVPITAVIDKTEIPVQHFLQLGPGSVLKLDKPVGAPVDLYLKNVRFATATVVVLDDRFAVRIKEILGTGAPANQPTEQLESN